eukprot:TRINITY_DN11156_c0_g1_i3.p1 TRINITY_DN11156_c0_g1~~TRINITY_DN11156_c0_g1_i3.p1  ORF type:complete len:113 (-),score=3.72 TRINITY_DN11156_c0_g1_i3:321-659(-)
MLLSCYAAGIVASLSPSSRSGMKSRANSADPVSVDQFLASEIHVLRVTVRQAAYVVDPEEGLEDESSDEEYGLGTLARAKEITRHLAIKATQAAFAKQRTDRMAASPRLVQL